MKTVHNVIGYLPGLTSEYIVIGAHYDHLGLGEQFSMAPSLAGTVHPGADDNASGAAGVIELARYLGAEPKPKRGVLFMTFAGEELGLLGSSYYVNHPGLPLDKAVAMLNMENDVLEPDPALRSERCVFRIVPVEVPHRSQRITMCAL